MKSKDAIMNIVIAVLSVGLAITLIMTVHSFWETMRVYTHTETSLLYQLQDEEYMALLDDMYDNEAKGVHATKDMEKCYAVARYYEAAVAYKMYQEAGLEEALRYKTTMEEQRELMGEFEYAADNIDKKLELK